MVSLLEIDLFGWRGEFGPGCRMSMCEGEQFELKGKHRTSKIRSVETSWFSLLNIFDIKKSWNWNWSERCANLPVPRGEFSLSLDPWLTHNIIVSLIRDQILHSPGNALLAQVTPAQASDWLTRGHVTRMPASDWLTRGHVTRMPASDWSPDECHMSRVTYLECVTLSGRTAHNLAHSLCRHVKRTSIIQYRLQCTAVRHAMRSMSTWIAVSTHFKYIWLLNLICIIQFISINELINPCTCLLVEDLSYRVNLVICVPPSSKPRLA